MEGERILKSLLNGNTDHLFDDIKNYLAPFKTTFESKNGLRAGASLADETLSKYSVFCTKFMRCAVETLKTVKSKGDDLGEIATSLNLVSTVLSKTLTSDNGKYLKYIPSLDQLGKTLYLLVLQLLSKSLFDQAFSHANHLLKYLQLLKKCKSYGTDKTAKEFNSIASRMSETLLQGGAKLEATKVTAVERASHLCLVLEWRKLSLLFQAESVSLSSVKCLVDRTLKCGTKYQLDCGQRNISHKTLATFFETVLNTLLGRKDLLLKKNCEGSEALLSFTELGFHYGRICHKVGKQKDALTLLDKLLDITKELNPSPNGHTKMPLQICFCVCSICKSAILASYTGFEDLKAETQDSVNQLLFQGVDILRQVTRSQLITSSILKLLSDSLEYFRIILQNLCNKHTNSQSATGHRTSCLPRRIFQAVEQTLQLYCAVLNLQCEQLKVELLKASNDANALQLRQLFDRAVERQLSVSNFIISLYQDQLKSEEDSTDSDKDFRLQITQNCLPVAHQASELIHNALVDSEMFSLSAKELRWLGCNIYNLGCLLYQSDSFSEAVPLLALACDNLKAWCFAAEGEHLGLARIEEIKLLTKYTLLSDCQRRARQFTNAVATATTQVVVGLQMSSDREIIRQQVKQWTAAKHELVKSLQDGEKHFERERTLCTALAEQNDASDVVGSQLALVLEEELACYRAKSYDSAVEEIAVIRQLMELYSVEDNTFHFGSSTLEFAIVLHTIDNEDIAEYKSPLEYCQEAVEILKQLSDESENQEEINGCHLSAVQDRLAVAYMWRAVLEHEQSIKQAKISVDYDSEEVEAVSLKQPFMLSLHSALKKWTCVAKHAILEPNSGKIDLTHFYNAEETSHYQLVTAAFYGLLNQPFNRVQALNLAATMYKAIGTQHALNRALSAYSEAVHSLCDILNVTHACVMLENATDMLGTFEPDGVTKVQFLLCKSHYCLVSGKYTEGEECLEESLNSDVMSQKNYKSHMLRARLNSIAMKYLQLPSHIYELTAIKDPLLGPLTALEVALDGFRKLSHIGEKIFGEQVFHFGKKTGQRKEHNCEETSCTGKGDGMLISSDSDQSAFQLSVLLDLLSSLLQVGQLYAHQGAVREAYRQFIDGVTLARHFQLPHRIAEFLVSIAQLDLKQGKMDKGKVSLDELKAILQPLLKPSSKKKHLKEGMEVATFVEHTKECDCNRCGDVVLHFIVIDYFLIQSSYLACSSRPELSISTLEEADVVCETAEQKIITSLEKLNENIGQEQKIDVDSNSKRTRKKGKSCKTVQAAKALKQGLTLQSSSISQLMLSKHCASLYFINAKLLLHNGKIEKAREVLSGALEFLAVSEKVSSVQVATLYIKASLIHLSGLADLLCVIEGHSYGGVHFRWFPGNGEDNFLTTNTASRTKQTVLPLCAPNEDEEKASKPRKSSSSTNTRNPKTAKTRSTKGNSRKKPSVASSTGKKKVQEGSSECNYYHDKAKGNEQVNGEATDCKDMERSVEKGSRYLHQAIQSFNQALGLCHGCPPPELFSSVCQALAFCHCRSFPRLAMHYLNLSASISLRHQAVSSLGKRFRRLAKDASFSSLLGDKKHMTKLVHQLSSLSLQEKPSSDVMSSGVCEKLKHLIMERNVMMFKSNNLKKDDFNIVDEEMSFVQSIPQEWTVCMLELFQLPGRQDKELIICRLQAGSEPVLVKINTSAGEEKARDSVANSDVDHVVMDLTKLFQCSVEEEFNDIMSDSVKSMSVGDTSEWWTQRTRLDNRMKNLLEKIETSWLGGWKGILLGKPVNKDYHDSVKDAAKCLQERIEQMLGNTPDLQLLEVIIDSSSQMSKMEIKEAFLEIIGLDEASPFFKDIMLVFEEITASLFSPGKKKAKGKKTKSNIYPVTRNPVILILGKGIQQLPWESIPILYDQPVTRVPSLQFLLSKLSCQKQLPLVNPMKTFYMLNPQNNLPNTQKMFQEWFESENGWQGISGSAPSQKEFSSALTDHELFIYFGHGTGREFLIGDDIQRLDCQAVTLLMGCSSGKLMMEGECEPRGMVLNYLIAGCPAIVANLWDVTDKDIDRFSESLLKLWLQQREHLSLPEALSQSRQACRLKYLIGASPVVYGLPVYTKD